MQSSGQLDDRVFQFLVSSKQVCFAIYNLKSFECKHFKGFFNGWGNGGASWARESELFDKEEDAEDATWTSFQQEKICKVIIF